MSQDSGQTPDIPGFPWKDVKSTVSSALRAEQVATAQGNAQVLLMVVVEDSDRSYLVTATAICFGKRPWQARKEYRDVPSATRCYQKFKEQAEEYMRLGTPET